MSIQMLLWIWVHTLCYCFLPLPYSWGIRQTIVWKTGSLRLSGWEVHWSWTSGILVPQLPASENHCSCRKGSLVLHTPVSLVPSYRCPALYITVQPYILLTMVVPAERAYQKNYFKTCNLFLLVLVTCIYHQRSFSQKLPTWLFCLLKLWIILAWTWIWLCLHSFSLLSWILFLQFFTGLTS